MIDKLFIAACVTLISELLMGCYVVFSTGVGPCGFAGAGVDFWVSFHRPGTKIAEYFAVTDSFRVFVVRIATSATIQVGFWYLAVALGDRVFNRIRKTKAQQACRANRSEPVTSVSSSTSGAAHSDGSP